MVIHHLGGRLRSPAAASLRMATHNCFTAEVEIQHVSYDFDEIKQTLVSSFPIPCSVRRRCFDRKLVPTYFPAIRPTSNVRNRAHLQKLKPLPSKHGRYQRHERFPGHIIPLARDSVANQMQMALHKLMRSRATLHYLLQQQMQKIAASIRRAGHAQVNHFRSRKIAIYNPRSMLAHA